MYIPGQFPKLVLRFRQKGETREFRAFVGQASVITSRSPLKFAEHVRDALGEPWGIDLTALPVMVITGSGKRRGHKVVAFLEEHPEFEGVFLLYPGSGDWDIDEGFLLFTSRSLLEKVRPIEEPASGHKPAA